MRGPITILIADAYPLVREGLKRILQDSGEFEVVAEASSAYDAGEQVRALGPEVVLLDVDLPPQGGLGTLLELKRAEPSPRVLMLGPASVIGLRALREGASGYLTPELTPEQLLDAIRRVQGGGQYMSPELAEFLAVRLVAGEERARHELLSQREFDVLRRLAAGQTTGEIAAELHLSVKTVSTYRSRALEKLGLRNNAELVQYALREGLLV